MNDTTANEPRARAQIDVLKVEVLEALRALKARAEQVRQALVDEAGYAWVWRDPMVERPPTEPDRVYAAWALTETDYISDEQKPQDTLCAPGVITASPQTMIRIDELNAARERFMGVCHELKNTKIKIDGKHERLVTYWLRTHGFGRINRRQTYRHIVTIGHDQEQPTKIAFSWCAPSRMKTFTREQLRHLIQTGSRSDEAIERHLATLDSVRDPKFVQVREASVPQPRANLWFESAREPVMHTSAIPLVIADIDPLPRIKPISENRVSPARERKWHKLLEAPFIPELSIHRYQQYAS